MGADCDYATRPARQGARSDCVVIAQARPVPYPRPGPVYVYVWVFLRDAYIDYLKAAMVI